MYGVQFKNRGSLSLLLFFFSFFFFARLYWDEKLTLRNNKGVLEDFKGNRREKQAKEKKEKKKEKRRKKRRKTKKRKKKNKFFSLPSKTMGCFSGRLMSAASDQKLFCQLCSPFCCSFDEFVEEKGISPSYFSAILTPPPTFSWLHFKPDSIL